MTAEQRPPTASERTFASFLSFLLGPIGAAFISFLALPITTWLISPEELGRGAMFLIAYQMALLALCLGLDNSFIREFHGSQDRAELFRNSVTTPVIASLVVAAGVMFFYVPLSNALFGEESLLGAGMFALTVVAGVFDRFSLLCVRMQDRGKLYSSFTILRYTVRLALLVPLLMYFGDFRGLVVAEGLTMAVSAAVTTSFARDYWRHGFGFRTPLMKTLFHYGLPLIPASIISSFFISIDKIALRTWATFEELGLYATAYRVIGVLLILRGGFRMFWSPNAYRWHEEGNFESRAPRVSRVLSISLIALAGVVILLRGVIVTILSPEYESAQAFIPLLAFIPVFGLLSEVTMVGINFVKKTSLHLYISVLVAGANLAGNYALVPEYGAMGACISTAVAYLLLFWARTGTAMIVWRRFAVGTYAYVSVVVTAMAVAPLAASAAIANAVVAFLVLLSLAIYRSEIRTVVGLAANLVSGALRR